VQKATLEEFAELIAQDALRAKLTTEILTWHPADQPPPTHLLVMMCDEYGWRAGYWDGEQWRDEENMVVTLVMRWWALLVADDVVRLGRCDKVSGDQAQPHWDGYVQCGVDEYRNMSTGECEP
jgi:hypothetical protein